jgi:hypothetical protein
MRREPGTYVVCRSRGLQRVERTKALNGKTFVVLEDEVRGAKMFVPLEEAMNSLRALISREEAERRLAILRWTVAEPDLRPLRERHPVYMRTREKGTDDERVRVLQQLYASPFSRTYHEDRIVDLYEGAVVDEIAHVLARPNVELVQELHEVHSVTGSFAKTAGERPPEAPVPSPKPPFPIGGHDFLGAFSVEGVNVVAGDPNYVDAAHDQPAAATQRGNLHVDVIAGEWLAYVRRATSGERVDGLVVIHASFGPAYAMLLESTTNVGTVVVDSGRIVIVDAYVRDDGRYDDAIRYRYETEGILQGRGCMSTTGDGDGAYDVRVARRDGKGVLIAVEF